MPRSFRSHRRGDILIGQRIRLFRHASGISAEEMARVSGLDIGEYASCELGEARFKTAELYEIGKALKVRLTDIVGVIGSTVD
ncbi:helix-turn-helix transcriptional regulator [Hyphomicrobium sp.]|uniref:helix-turn-helix domain-containing protein n=1 Tax=Hyphomicrobium sp. TaxID=82 RepID=UPI000FB7B745|nr:helix-turn-helix transcriptional regulator [Hyphomicrobium sp.]MBN9246865.1 helix-turn-helix transcriptional regulator [Hyphomicrobium sp.]RUP07899.1 MAG: XRE family transcriptional regulator [Hyphomicrobium sp.]